LSKIKNELHSDVWINSPKFTAIFGQNWPFLAKNRSEFWIIYPNFAVELIFYFCQNLLVLSLLYACRLQFQSNSPIQRRNQKRPIHISNPIKNKNSTITGIRTRNPDSNTQPSASPLNHLHHTRLQADRSSLTPNIKPAHFRMVLMPPPIIHIQL
jgi:hypothetical protein